MSAAGKWSQVEVAGHPCDVFEPPHLSPHGFTLIYLHGVHLNRLHDQQGFLEQFDRYGLRVVAPLTGRSWWTDRIAPEFDPEISAERFVAQHMVGFIRERWNSQSSAVALLGTSMGGQGALRLAFRHPKLFPVVAAISPAIDFHHRWKEGDPALRAMYRDAEAARQDTATLHVHALNWPPHIWFSCDPADERWHESADRLQMKLSALGIPHEHDLTTRAGGHGFEYYNAMAPAAVGFIAERLERERLRVV